MKKNIQILLPVCNDKDRVEQTLQSIQKQTYDREKFHTIAVDFASTDGTYELLLSYAGYHVGIYKKTEQVPRERMIAEIVKLSLYLWPEGYDGLYMVLYPGEILYPNALELCMGEYENHCKESPVILLCEADIQEDDGSIHAQKNMFAQSRILLADNAMDEYTCRGYDHQIIMLSSFLFINRHRDAVEMNEQRWWNKCSKLCGQRNTLYVSKPIGCVKRIQYEDEVEEILLRWESLIAQIRRKKLDETLKNASVSNLSQYALWRSMELYEKKGFDMETEDCFLLASLICPDIVELEQYQNIKRLLYGMV